MTEDGFHRGDDDVCLEGYQIYPDQRYAKPRIDNDTFIEHAIENIHETGSAGRALGIHK
jgi:hypothetical protein